MNDHRLWLHLCTSLWVVKGQIIVNENGKGDLKEKIRALFAGL